ncbi:D-alanine--D-alanine ligase [Pelagicoccus sp. SDUM812003]|uniref:D-alanine--D-alanine ligase family protein n=1 Tax=Pelagicoccus sp. SDUM812003 TaxID=3041267 RepID=UPI00280E50AA|nr:D-alanine--D-alanine ligase [Pelagicoccus sp. SDUM812003]MDQ8204415.1 D-alanine--D-alanine ligase [Pelagicoccus sp. SDUM812003]
MMDTPRIAVLYGGISKERDVSLGSGLAAAAALEANFEVDRFDVKDRESLPEGLDPKRHVVFSTLHGSFGEDGSMQQLLEDAGVVYAGCDVASSALTFDKAETKRVMKEAGVPVADEIVFELPQKPTVERVLGELGPSIVLKPVAQGSSVGLVFAQGETEIAAALESVEEGKWLIEPRIQGRETTIGILHGKPLDIVEIRPRTGRFDYESKYTKGLTEYIAPAPLNEKLAERIRNLATIAFEACGCRDYARIDIMIDEHENLYFLEINTLPGLKETSLLPMSAAGCGYNFEELLQKLVEPAILRYKLKYSIC